MKKIFLVVLLSFVVNFIQAQNTLYNYNFSLINPAYVGLDAPTKIAANGFIAQYKYDNSPYYQGVVGFERRLKPLHGALGVYLNKSHFYDLINTFDGSLIYNFHINLSDTKILAFGIDMNFGTIKYNFNNLYLDPYDPVFSDFNKRQYGLNTRLGALYSSNHLITGAAVYLNLLKSVNTNFFQKDINLIAGLKNIQLINNKLAFNIGDYYLSNINSDYKINYSYLNFEILRHFIVGSNIIYNPNNQTVDNYNISYNIGFKLNKNTLFALDLYNSDGRKYVKSWRTNLGLKVCF